VGVGSYFGLHAKSQLDASNANGHCGSHNLCDPTGMSDRSSAQSAATASTVLFIAGGVALAGAGVLWFTAPSGEVEAPATGRALVAPWWTGRAGGVAVDVAF
jgi:hypothetical protein